MYQEKTSAQLAEIIRESGELPMEAAKELCTRAGLAWAPKKTGSLGFCFMQPHCSVLC